MGMFDTVHPEVELPDGLEPGRASFQTKDLDCLLHSYKIAKDGALLLYQDWDKKWRHIDFTGEVVFYGSDGDDDWRIGGKPGRWHQYRAYFAHGMLKSLVVDEDANAFFNRERSTG